MPAYELYLRGPGAAAALAAAAPGAPPVALRPWVREAADPARPEGIDLETPLGSGDPEALCRTAFDLAGRFGLAVFDPQLGCELLPDQSDAVRARWTELSAWTADTIGGPGPPPVEEAPLAARLVPWLLLGGAVVVGLLALRSCARFLAS